MLTLETVKNKVQKMLIDLNGGIRIDKDGDFEIIYNSAHVFISIEEIGPDDNKRFLVRFVSPMVFKVPVTHELCLHIATEGTNYRFGCINLNLKEDGKTGDLYFVHTILANDLDQSEVDNAIKAVLFTAEGLDTELHKKFGGEMFGRDED